MVDTGIKNIICTFVALALLTAGCERLAWRKAMKENTTPAYQGYLSEYPEGRHSSQARIIIETRAFREAMREDNPDALKAYIERFPESKYADMAGKRMQTITRVQVDKLTVKEMAAARILVGTSMGGFVIRLFAEDAPETGRNLIYLGLIDFYNGIEIHKVVRDSFVLMGDPRGSGLGGPGYMIPMEKNDRRHVRGAVSMWRLPVDPDTAGSQFLICIKDLPEMDGYYTVFGEVVEGMETLDRISSVETAMHQGRPIYRPIEPVNILRLEVAGLDIEW
jgi:peptidyl-prolyl cis-trans isomerase B (cyclophilin B)